MSFISIVQMPPAPQEKHTNSLIQQSIMSMDEKHTLAHLDFELFHESLQILSEMELPIHMVPIEAHPKRQAQVLPHRAEQSELAEPGPSCPGPNKGIGSNGLDVDLPDLQQYIYTILFISYLT